MKDLKKYTYLTKSDYDIKCKVAGKTVSVYSQAPADNPVGEVNLQSQKAKDKDIGTITFENTQRYVSPYKSHRRLFYRRVGFAETDGGILVLLKPRLALLLLPILLVCVLLAVLLLHNTDKPPEVDIDRPDNNAVVVDTSQQSISGTVYKVNIPTGGAGISLQQKNTELTTAFTNLEGQYGIGNVADGHYSVVASLGNSVLTEAAQVDGAGTIVDFYFPAGDVKALLSIVSEETPNITVSGLAEEAALYALPDREVDLTFFAELLHEENVPAEDRKAITAISGETELMYLDFSLLKEIFKQSQLLSSEYLHETQTVFEIAVPFDSTTKAGTYVFRSHNGEGLRFTQLSQRPDKASRRDGTYYVEADTVYIYANKFSTYAIGTMEAGGSTMGSDMIVFSDGATVYRSRKSVSMYYSHSASATHDVRVELYLKGGDEDTCIAKSGIVAPGNELETMSLTIALSQIPKTDSYEGFLRLVYLDGLGNPVTQVELPVTVSFTE